MDYTKFIGSGYFDRYCSKITKQMYIRKIIDEHDEVHYIQIDLSLNDDRPNDNTNSDYCKQVKFEIMGDNPNCWEEYPNSHDIKRPLDGGFIRIKLYEIEEGKDELSRYLD